MYRNVNGSKFRKKEKIEHYKFEDFTIRINNDWLPYISEDKIEDNLKTMFT